MEKERTRRTRRSRWGNLERGGIVFKKDKMEIGRLEGGKGIGGRKSDGDGEIEKGEE